MNNFTVLTVDDSGDDTLLFQRACRKSGTLFNLQTVNDGQHAIDYLSGNDVFADRQQYPLPSLLLLDLKMPGKNGFEVLEWVRDQNNSKDLPVVIFTSSDNHGDIRKAYQKGANWYVMKPVDYSDLMTIARTINSYLTTSDSQLLPSLQNFRANPGDT
ncbi:MAG: response regulator [Verrucomicrobiota bacterium]